MARSLNNPPKTVQELLAIAEDALSKASAIADESGIGFTFRKMRYIPKQVVLGSWDIDGSGSEWEPSDC